MFEKVFDPNKAIVLKGKYIAELYDADGRLKQKVEGSNVVCTNGKEFLASFLNVAAAGATQFTMKYLAIGAGATAESASDTALGSELSRHTGTVSYVSNQIYQVKATFAAGSGTGAVAEYGLFSANTAGTMISRDTESVINKGALDTLTVTYQLSIG